MKKLCVFAKNPELGLVKTRLKQSIGAEAALEVYLDLLGYTKRLVSSLDSNINVKFYFSKFKDPSIWKNSRIQAPGDIGNKMHQCFVEEVENPEVQVIIIGSDSFEIQMHHIEEAFECLINKDIVLGPALDGGYYLIGMKKPWPEIFHDVDWGTSIVLEQTLEKCKLLALETHLLETISDVDVIEDLSAEYLLEKNFKI